MDVGTTFSHYKIIEHIGRGGMADVWSARDRRLNRMVAIKTIAHGLSQEADPVGLFRKEAQTIAQMEHPHVLPIYDFGENQGKLYIVMRYVAGGSLEEILRAGPLPVDEVMRLGQAVAQALDYAHSSNVIHLDLKPANVLLDSHKSPYLADFGLATKLDPEGKAANPGSGTLLYMAPEQMTSETIDHRADIYSFCIVMFHMLTGQLPFEGTNPLALRQLQHHDDLPYLEEINPSLPGHFTEILRRGTSVSPEERPQKLEEIINQMRDAVMASSTYEMVAMGFGDDFTSDEYDPFAAMDDVPENANMEILEAVEIYSRARHNWAGGNGRFLIGVTHFMLMNGYYMDADTQGLQLDLEGQQMLLRGALEYDHEVDFWWGQLDDQNRRWVCLHALRSGNAPARVRALYRLETLPDAEKPQIPKLVAAALQVETDETARLAALQVLGTRAKLMKGRQSYEIKTEYRGRMLTTMTRLGIQVTTPAIWRDSVYSPEIDLLIAKIALDYAMPQVAEFAARIIGRIRSTTSVRYLVNEQNQGRKGSLRALALVRDEAHSLPDVVTAQGQLYAWGANTLRRLFDRPWVLFFRFIMALIGGWLAMGINVWTTFYDLALFTPQRWGNTLAMGMMFGLFTGFLVLFAGEFSSRLRGFWAWWAQLTSSMMIGFLLGVAVWVQFHWMYLQRNPDELYWRSLLIGGAGIALGFVITSFLNLRSWFAIPLTAIATYLPILYTWQYYLDNWQNNNATEPLIYYLNDYDRVYTVAIPLALFVAFGGHFPRLLRDLQYLRMQWRNRQTRLQSTTSAAKSSTAPAAKGERLPAAAARIVPNKNAPLLQTEIDINQGVAPGNTEPLTTKKVQKPQVETMGSSAEQLPKSERVDLGTGIIVNRNAYKMSDAPTELDPSHKSGKSE